MIKCIDCKKIIRRKNKTGYCGICVHRHIKTTGYKHTDDNKLKFSECKKADKNPNWKGNSVGYRGLHIWVRTRMPKPLICPKCNINPALDLSNKGIYDRNLENWEWLCRKCHMDSDGRKKNLIQYRDKKI